MNLRRHLVPHLFILFFICTLSAQETAPPFKVDSLYDFNKPQSLGLEFAAEVETFAIFSPEADENKYNHGVVLFPFKGMLYAQWQSSKVTKRKLVVVPMLYPTYNKKAFQFPERLSIIIVVPLGHIYFLLNFTLSYQFTRL